MFERFTKRARRVLVLAQEEARNVGHDYIGTEHILLGLIQEGEGLGAKALGNLGVDLEAMRGRILDIVPPGDRTRTAAPAPFTPRSKKVLELSLRSALKLGHNYIGTEHLLLGLLAEGEGLAMQVLVAAGIDLDRAEREVRSLIDDYVAMEQPRRSRSRAFPFGRRGEPYSPAPPAPRVPRTGRERARATPAGERIPTVAEARAGRDAVGSHHYLLALLDDPTSAASRVLESFGVTTEATETRLFELGVGGTSDEVAQRDRWAVETTDAGLTIRIKDPDLAAAVRRGDLAVSFERADDADGDDGVGDADAGGGGDEDDASAEAILDALGGQAAIADAVRQVILPDPDPDPDDDEDAGEP
ncbi:MAG TPA: Clp protease N-terminal domain-containing protein [Acidimicrobiales bacterium]